MSIKCKPFKHEWSKWEDVKSGSENGWPTIIQEKRCTVCNMVKLRGVSSK